jgi:hypothetical protein
LAVLTALATAPAPLTADQLAQALGWQLHRVAAAIAAAYSNPVSSARSRCAVSRPKPGPSNPGSTILTKAQRRALRDTTAPRPILEEDKARVLLAALAAGQSPAYAELRSQPGWTYAETALKETGLLYTDNGPHRVHLSDDVKFSLRYSDDRHIADELGEPHRCTHPSRVGPPTH